MTDTTKQDPHAELMRLIKNVRTMVTGQVTWPDDYNQARLGSANAEFNAYARKLTDRITELESQLEAVGAGGVGQRWPVLEKPAALQAGGMFGKGVSSRLLVEAAYRHYERTEAERTKTPEQRKDDEVRRRALWDIIHGEPTQPAPAVVGPEGITLDFKQVSELLEMFGGEPAEITIQHGEGHSGKGLYAYYTDLPEEGAGFLGSSDNEAIPIPQPHQIAEPASPWVSVSERLPVWVVRDDTPCFINGKEIPPTLFSETVLVALKGGGVRTDKLTTIEGKSEGWWHTYGERVAAWMLAPKPPTQKEPS